MAGVAAVGVMAVALLPATASAAPCDVTTAPQLTTALANATCDPIVLAAGTYSSAASPGFTMPNRDVTLQGSGASQTTLTKTGSGNIVYIPSSAGVNVTLMDLRISGASSGSGVFVDGGATTSLLRTVIANNTTSAGGGGGIWGNLPAAGTLSVTDSVIADNTDNSFQGGGVLNSNVGVLNFNRVLFSGNESNGNGGGGGLSNGVVGATTNLTNVTFTGNRAIVNGGAIRNTSNATVNLTAGTVAGNTADYDVDGLGDGGGVYNELGSTANVRESIIANNADGTGESPDCSGQITRKGYELIRSVTGCTFGGTGDTAAGYSAGVDPLLGPLAQNGGTFASMALLSGSPAIDAIPVASCSTNTDQRKFPRPRGAGCDLGAYEVADGDGDGIVDVNDDCPAAAGPAALGGCPDRSPPQTTITKRPKNRSHRRKAKFKFNSDEPGSSFECKLDKKKFKPCSSPKVYKVKPGRHKFQVRAIDPAGNVDPSPAKDKFKVLG